MNSCSPDFLCIAYTLVCESQFVGDFIRMRVTYTAKWGLQIAEMIFQTRSRTYCYTYLSILHPNEQLYLSIPSFLRDIQ